MMARMFSEQEKQKIREILMQKGKELFGTMGLKKTSVEDLTRAAGIAKGSFYIFFDSKEELFFELMQIEEQILREKIYADNLENKPVTAQRLKAFVLQGLRMVEESAIFKRLYIGDEFQLLMRKLPVEKLNQHTDRDTGFFGPLLHQWQEQGLIVQDTNVEVIVGAFRAIFLISLHKRELGEEIFDDSLDFLLDLFCKGLIKNNTAEEQS
jgi:AcrR family transcriptional regulator